MMRIRDNLIIDNEGRTLILRGVNLGGSSKCPSGPPGSGLAPEFLNNPGHVSFIGRPFPLEEAQEHFGRLKKAGMTFIRLVITWEALEHEGPGIYDEAYLAYLRKIVLAAEGEGVSVFIDPHQDVWSRWTGGDGAPAWTMEKLGFDLEKTDLCGAAVTRQRYGIYHRSRRHPDGEPFPRMMWPSNYNRYAAATMFTLFFAGRAYAADVQADGEHIQDWLQNRYIAAFKHAQRRLKNCANIAGWGAMNEPHFGFIGHQNLEQAENIMVPVGPRPSPWQAVCAASGYPVKVPVHSASSFGKRVSHYETFNPQGVSLFKDGYSCPWKQAGVWSGEGGARLLRPGHFSRYQGRRPVFADDFLKPFMAKFVSAVNEADEKRFFFIEGMPHSLQADSCPSWGGDDPPGAVNAFHWYDGFSLFTKSFHSWFTVDPYTAKIIIGRKKVQAYFTKCLAQGIALAKQKMGDIPSLLGEFGLAFDLNNRSGFAKGGYSLHEDALSMYYDAVDANLLHSTIWNYTADNTNKYGDGWNDEDLSVFSEGKERAAAGWKRPYPMATAGTPLLIKWDRKRKVFVFRFTADGSITEPGIIYLPIETFGPTPEIKTAAPGGSLRWDYKPEEQRLFVYNDGCSGEAEVTVRARSVLH